MPSGNQVPSTVTGRPTCLVGNGSSGPSTSVSGSGSSLVRSTRSASRWACQASYCQSPSATAAPTQTIAIRWAPHNRGLHQAITVSA